MKLVSEVASGMRDHTRVDGTNRFVSPESLEGIILEEILSKNKKGSSRPFAYSHDAIIAEASAHYGCVLVSNDVELRKIVNSFISNGAITVEKLLEIINKNSEVKGQGGADTP